MDRRDPRSCGLLERAVFGNAAGFTLAELLVVITIIAILAGMLFPVLSQARDTARMRTCAEQLRELAKAFSMYLDDNNGFAISPSSSNLPYDRTLQPDPLMKYVKQSPPTLKYVQVSIHGVPQTKLATRQDVKRVWICPGDRGASYNWDSNENPSLEDYPRWCCYGQARSSYWYGYDAYLVRDTHTDYTASRKNAPRRPDQWAKLSRDVLLCDWSYNFHKGRKDGNPDSAVKCVNFVMLDGHLVAGTKWDLVWLHPAGIDYDEYDARPPIPYYAIFYDNPYSLFYDPTR